MEIFSVSACESSETPTWLEKGLHDEKTREEKSYRVYNENKGQDGHCFLFDCLMPPYKDMLCSYQLRTLTTKVGFKRPDVTDPTTWPLTIPEGDLWSQTLYDEFSYPWDIP